VFAQGVTVCVNVTARALLTCSSLLFVRFEVSVYYIIIISVTVYLAIVLQCVSK